MTVLQIKVNPIVNLYLNNENMITEVECVNDDAELAYADIKRNLKGAELSSGIELIIATAIDKGYLTADKEVTIDVIKIQEKNKESDILKIANRAAQTVLEKNKLDVNVKTLVDGKIFSIEVLKNESEAMEEETQSITEKEIEKETEKLPEKSTEKTTETMKEPITEKATEAVTESEAKNPKMYIEMNTKYIYYCEDSYDNLYKYHMVFCEDGTFNSACFAYVSESRYNENMGTISEDFIINYNGIKYYGVGGGDGCSGTYSLMDNAINVTTYSGGNVVLKITANDSIVVESTTLVNDSRFKEGNSFILEK